MSDSSSTQETTTNDNDSPISKPPEQNNPVNAKPVRRVCFSQLPPRKYENKKKPRNKLKISDRPGPGCCLCCAWTCLLIFAFFLLLLLFGTLFFVFLRSELPEIRLQKMSFPQFDIIIVPPSSSSSSSSQKTLLSADVELLIEVSNKNQKVGLSYGTLTVNVRSEKIELGQTEVVGFYQDPKNVKVIKVHTSSVTKSQVEKEEGALLKSNFNNKKLVLDVILYGNVGFNVGASLKINGLPVMVECMKIEQSMVDVGQYPKCSFKIKVFRALFNAVNGGW